MTYPVLQRAGYFHSDLAFGSDKTTPHRRVNLYEIEYILEDGDCTVMDDITYTIQKNTILIARPGEIRHSYLTRPMQSMYLWVTAEGECAEKLNVLPHCFPVIHMTQIYTHFQEIINSYIHPNGEWFYTMGKLLLLLSYLTTDAAIPGEYVEKEYPIVHQAKKYMDENYVRKITATDVAAYMNLSESYLRTIFKRIYGITMYRYLCDKRIETAKQMLCISTDSIAEIANDCGYGSMEYFIAAFRKETGMTPGAYRKIMACNIRCIRNEHPMITSVEPNRWRSSPRPTIRPSP